MPDYPGEVLAIAMLLIKAYVSYLSSTFLVRNYTSDVIRTAILYIVNALHYNFKDVAVNVKVLFAV
jgi:hypothetical protein